VYNTKVVKTIEANTGWIDEDHFDWLMELLETNRCYNYTENDQNFVVVKQVNYRKSSNDDLFNIDVVFEDTLYQNSISV
jgi:transposase